MSEYIDKERFLRVLDKNFCSIGGTEVLKQIIEAQPPADVRPVVRGEWLNFYNDFSMAECSECAECFEVSPEEKPQKEFFEMFKEFYNFCPNCGADMRGKNK